MSPRGWPARLAHGAVEVRPLRARDASAWCEVRTRNEGWLAPWEGRPPSQPPASWAERHSPAVFAVLSVWGWRAWARGNAPVAA